MAYANFHYIGYMQVDEGKIIPLETQWAIDDPMFHPEEHSPKIEMAKAVFMLGIPEDGVYRLRADGEIELGFDEDGGKMTAQILINNSGYETVGPSIVAWFTNDQPRRPVFFEVNYQYKPAS